MLTLNSHYAFRLTAPFDALNGIFQVIDILTYDRVIEEELDLFELLYSKIGKTAAELDEDIVKHQDGAFYHLKDSNTRASMVVPQALIAATDPEVLAYTGVMIAADLGFHLKSELTAPVAHLISEAVLDYLGAIKRNRVMPEEGEAEEEILEAEPIVEIQEYGKLYLTVEEYEKEVALRRTMVNRRRTIIGETHVQKAVRLEAELEVANSKVAKLVSYIKENIQPTGEA